MLCAAKEMGADPAGIEFKRHQVAGYYVYQIANSGYQWFERWRFMMSLREWKAEIPRMARL